MTGNPIFSVNFTNRKNHAGSGTRNMIVSVFSWIFAVCEIYWKYKTAGHLMFWKPWPVVDLKKVPSVTKDSFVFWAQRKLNAKLEIYEAFQDRLTFFNRLKWFRLAGFSIFDYWEHIGPPVISVLKTLTAANFIFAAGVTLRGHEADLFQAYWFQNYFLSFIYDFVSYRIYLWCDVV